MNAIAPGTPCFLVALVEREELNGRVVEVIGPTPAPEGEFGDWYSYTSRWGREVFGDRETVVGRVNLRPIVPPGIAPPKVQKRPQETIEP